MKEWIYEFLNDHAHPVLHGPIIIGAVGFVFVLISLFFWVIDRPRLPRVSPKRDAELVPAPLWAILALAVIFLVVATALVNSRM